MTLLELQSAIINLLMHMKNMKLSDKSIFLPVADNNSKCCKTDLKEVFDEPCFLERLCLEKQRSQRSGSALSILLLTRDKTEGEGSVNISEMLKTVQKNIRDTDIVGYVDQHTLGVLLPYTDKEGANNLGEKIINNKNIRLAITTSTYPHQIFDSLAIHNCVSPEILKLMLEDSINHSRLKLQVKRTIDIIGSIAAMLVLSPIMLITAILIKVNSPGPVIFKQARLGKKGASFTFYKFRSMRTDTNDQIHRDYVLKLINGDHTEINNGNEENPLYKIKCDPRITALGRFIRKTSIDELPQLFNVLKGDMSLTGPRPPLAYEAEKYKAWHLKRILEMTPGITGLWQVDGRGRTTFDEAIRLDIRYLQTWSLWLDFKILFKTGKVVLGCKGAV